jgi:hypothetical protein
MRAIRLDVEMIKDPLAVKKIAGVIIADSVAKPGGGAIGMARSVP